MLRRAGKPATQLSFGVRTTNKMTIVHRLFGDPSMRNILINVALWGVMAIGVLIALGSTDNMRIVAILIVAFAFIWLTLHNTKEIGKTKQDNKNME